MKRSETTLPELLSRLRWIIPVLLAVLGIGYTLIEHLLLTSHPVTPVDILREAAVIGTVGPVLAGVLLNWATNIARSRQQAEQALARRALQLETANQVGRQMTGILEIDELLKEVVGLIREQFGYYYVSIFLTDADGDEVALCEASGPAAAALKENGLRLKVGEEGIVGRVAAIGRPLVSNDVSRESHYHADDLVPETKSEVAIPLQVGQRILGVLDVQSDIPNAFDDTDVQTLQILGDQLAIAMENARLFEETRRRSQAMTALYETSLDLASRLESRQVLKAILRRAAGLLDVKGGALGIYDMEEDRVRIVAVHNLPAEYEGIEFEVGEGVTGTVIKTGEPLIVNEYRQWEGATRFLDIPYDAVVGVPLRWEDRVIGCLDVLDQGERHPFVDEDVWLLSAFADLASVAIKNAELYGEVTRLNRELEERVAQRTEQLTTAQAELAQKAEQLQGLLLRMIRAQEEERARIARDMHDSTAQLILGTLYATQAAKGTLDTDLGATRQHMDMIQQFLEQLEVDIRRTIHNLRPPVLDSEGVVPALKQYVKRYEKLVDIPCTFRVSGTRVPLSDETKVAIYRIVQEALQNVAAHAEADSVFVSLRFESKQVCVIVEDDGRGFDPSAIAREARGHFGLIGMRERAENIGARLEIHSSPGEGTQVIVHVPVKKGRKGNCGDDPRLNS